MPRGGKRPGAGAPKGNLNAIKHGRHSLRLRALVRALASIPEVRDFFIEIRRQLQHERHAARIARQAIRDLLHSNANQNNPLIAYLLTTLPNGEKEQKPAEQSNPKENNRRAPTPESAPRR